MIWQLHFYIYTQKNEKQGPEQIFVRHVHSSIIHSSQKWAATFMSIDGWKDKQNVVNTYKEVLFSLKKKETLTRATT